MSRDVRSGKKLYWLNVLLSFTFFIYICIRSFIIEAVLRYLKIYFLFCQDVCPLPFNVEIIQPCVDVTKRNSSVQSVEEVQKALDDSSQAQLGYSKL